jgi:5-(carboxyamino)imidazole ribonucleotide synthase
MTVVAPGSTIGIIGGGQLGRMLAVEARLMGYGVVVLDPEPGSPCSHVADEQIVSSFDDVQAALMLAEKSDVVTYEFENVDYRLVEAIEKKGGRVYPGSRALKVSQNRFLEKGFIRGIGIGVADYERIDGAYDLEAAKKKIGLPAVLKTVSSGYDGKGQAVLTRDEDVLRSFDLMRGRALLWERYVPVWKEISVVCARDARGNISIYPVSENIHLENILHMSIVPARIPEETEERGREIAETIALELGITGVLCVEMFLTEDGGVLVNEIAPRPHNSGHYTMDACVTSQFEQQLRAVCGLPLGSSRLTSRAVMVNILGEGKGIRLTGVEDLLLDPMIRLHLYGKREAKAKRKMGHFTVLGDDIEDCISRAEAAGRRLGWA